MFYVLLIMILLCFYMVISIMIQVLLRTNVSLFFHQTSPLPFWHLKRHLAICQPLHHYLSLSHDHPKSSNINHRRHPVIHPLWAILFYSGSSLRHCQAARVTAVSGRSQAPALAKGQNLEGKSLKTGNRSDKLSCKIQSTMLFVFLNTIDGQDPAGYHSGLWSGL